MKAKRHHPDCSYSRTDGAICSCSGYSRKERQSWQHAGRVVACSSCGDEIGGRLLLRRVDRGQLFGVQFDPYCIDCLVEVAAAEHGFHDLGAAPTSGTGVLADGPSQDSKE